MNITALYIYPIKAGPALSVDRAVAGPRGFDGDRRFMVTDPSGQFMTQRDHPALGRLSIDRTARGLRITSEDVGDVFVAAPTGAAADVKIWGDEVVAQRTTEEADQFFSELVNTGAQLVYMPEGTHRPTDEHPELPLSFADGYPYLVANVASLDDLNARIDGADVPMLAFRPNIVVDGSTAWAEDDWTDLTIGETRLTMTTNCERCSVTTLDPASPSRPRADGEPLRTLAEFRRNRRGKVEFARNAILAAHGELRVGDEVSS